MYDAEKITATILKFHHEAEELDEGRVLRGRFNKHNRGHRVNFVKHEPRKDIIGTDLTPDIVDYPEDTDLIKTGESSFDPSNPTYLVEPSDSVMKPLGNSLSDVVRPVPNFQEDIEYQLVEPSEVMWTRTTYADEDSGSDEDEDEDEVDEDDSDEEEGDEDSDEEDEEEGPLDDEEETSLEEQEKLYESIFMDGYVQANADNEVDVNDTKASEHLEVYMAGLRASGKLGRGRGRKGKGRGRGRKRSSSTKGGGRGTRRKTKSDDHF